MGPESERTVFRRVPNELLEHASFTSEAELGGVDNPDDRTAIFAPPSELLSELREQMARSDAEQRVTPVAPAPRFSDAPKSSQSHVVSRSKFPPRSLLAPGSLGSRSVAPGPRAHRVRTAFVAALVVLFLAATGYAYLRSGHGFALPKVSPKLERR